MVILSSCTPRGTLRNFMHVGMAPILLQKCVYQIKWNLPHKQQVVHFDRLKPYLTRDLDDERMPDESAREEHSLDETTENEALIQDRSTDETTSDNQYEEVLVEQGG